MLTPVHALPAFLSHQPLFRSLGSEACERLAAGASIEIAERGRFIYRSGAPYSGAWVVLGGKVKLTFSAPGGHERVVALALPGDTMGLECLPRERPYATSAQALQESRVMLLQKDALAAELERNPAFARAMLGHLSSRIEETLRDFEACTLMRGRERVANYLLRIAGPGAAELTLPVAKGVVASRLNLTQEHFSRILRQLAEDGLIEVLGRTIAIRDRPRLQSATM